MEEKRFILVEPKTPEKAVFKNIQTPWDYTKQGKEIQN